MLSINQTLGKISLVLRIKKAKGHLHFRPTGCFGCHILQFPHTSDVHFCYPIPEGTRLQGLETMYLALLICLG